MAEQAADLKENTTIVPHVLPHEEEPLVETQPEDSASSFSCTNSEVEDDSGENIEQADSKVDNNILSQAKEARNSDYNSKTPVSEESHKKGEITTDSHTMGEEALVMNATSNQGDRKDEEGDGLKDTKIGPGGDNGDSQEYVLPTEAVNTKDNELCSPTASHCESVEGKRQRNNVEIIGPTSEETTGPAVSEVINTVADSSSSSTPTNSEAEISNSENKKQSDIKNNEGSQDHDLPCDDTNTQEYTQTDPQDTEEQKNVQTIRSAFQEISEPSEAPGIFAGGIKYLIAASIMVVVVAIIVPHLKPVSPPQTNDVRQIDILLEQLEKVKTQFPTQRDELWKRSRIHLQRHLQTVQPTEPVSLILTAGLRAEKTLHCLAQDLASAYSSALNASVLHIDGASKARQDSDQVKLDIDRKLQGAFEGDQPVAVIHRFEELPPGSTLIFYRYCDHENAAYKKNFLIFTVLLGEEDEIPAKIRLSAVEEMVDDHLRKKFLSQSRPVSFDRMDLDKYGGLWSRISHLILPVAAEENIEREGCKET